MYECLYGYTPFACDDRHQTKLKILQHRKTLVFPQPEGVEEPSIAALDLMMSVLIEKERRLCSRQYESNDYTTKYHGGKVHRYAADKNHRDYQGYFVYPHDAEDLKRHRFFRDLNWETIHLRRPPYLPRVKGWEDTKYFQDEEPISDIDTATTVDENYTAVLLPAANEAHLSIGKTTQVSHHHHEDQHIIPSTAFQCSPALINRSPNDMIAHTIGFKNPLTPPRASAVPMNGATLVGTAGYADGQIEADAPDPLEQKAKRKDKKRPRDIILRDRATAPAALEARKLGAFLGYEYRQPVMAKDIIEQVLAEELTKKRFRDYRPSVDVDGLDRDLCLERRVYLKSGGQVTPQHSPPERILRYEHTLFGV